MLLGNAAHCNLVEVHLNDLKLSIPIMKPKAQLSEAINELMIQVQLMMAIKVNEAIIPPIIHNSKEAYANLRKVLDRQYSEMPFSYEAYDSSYGMIVTDLSPNKDSHDDQVLPNSTSSVVSLDMNFNADTTTPQQLICIGEFRNQLSIGYNTQMYEI
jgi:disulfide oxidoreductase YuzD